MWSGMYIFIGIYWEHYFSIFLEKNFYKKYSEDSILKWFLCKKIPCERKFFCKKYKILYNPSVIFTFVYSSHVSYDTKNCSRNRFSFFSHICHGNIPTPVLSWALFPVFLVDTVFWPKQYGEYFSDSYSLNPFCKLYGELDPRTLLW